MGDGDDWDWDQPHQHIHSMKCNPKLASEPPSEPPIIMKRCIISIVGLLWGVQPSVTTHAFLFALRSCHRPTRTRPRYDYSHHARWSTAVDSSIEAKATIIPTTTDESATATTSFTGGLPLEDFPQYQPSVLRGTTAQHSAAWQAWLLPSQQLLQPRSAGVVVDASVQWNPLQRPDTRQVAEQLLEQAGAGMGRSTITSSDGRRRAASSASTGSSAQHRQQRQLLLDDLEASLQSFVDFCQQYYYYSYELLHARPALYFKARIVATRGAAGTKCPQWHVDHVPVRWIQALVGPGCQWIIDIDDDDGGSSSSSAIHWDRINALNDDDDDDEDDDDDLVIHDTPDTRNRLLIDAKRAKIKQAAPGEAVLLLGKTWPDQPRIRPAVHKSPALSGWWQGRVLLTVDVVVGEETPSASM